MCNPKNVETLAQVEGTATVSVLSNGTYHCAIKVKDPSGQEIFITKHFEINDMIKRLIPKEA